MCICAEIFFHCHNVNAEGASVYVVLNYCTASAGAVSQHRQDKVPAIEQSRGGGIHRCWSEIEIRHFTNSIN